MDAKLANGGMKGRSYVGLTQAMERVVIYADHLALLPSFREHEQA